MILRRRLLRTVGLAAALAVPVAALAFAVRVGWHGVADGDESTIRAATAITRAHPALRDVLVVLQEALQPRWVVIGVALACLVAWRRAGLGRRALWAAGTMLLAWGAGNALKLAVERARPVVEDAVAQAPGYSFPSGHATNVTAGTGVVLVLVWPLLGRRGRVGTVVAGALLVAVTVTDRVLLGVHYPSDVAGGVLLGAAVVTGSAWGFLGARPPGGADAGARLVAHER